MTDERFERGLKTLTEIDGESGQRVLTALGGCEPQLEVHVNASLNVGLTPAEIVEALLHSAVYCGFPNALNATFTAKKVFGERGLLPVNQRS
ncbi:carboxymuconolactone decarboxylase family protein [Amycolatopsis sp. NPDC048633]|uniref:carboxymuconolactone decarboxylase family protein n=1 Tax=Amycolatopsis sp. NPDC048633 TaxID=3157095 RepID=UPI0033D10EBA